MPCQPSDRGWASPPVTPFSFAAWNIRLVLNLAIVEAGTPARLEPYGSVRFTQSRFTLAVPASSIHSVAPETLGITHRGKDWPFVAAGQVHSYYTLSNRA